jgi:hypothetical protein
MRQLFQQSELRNNNDNNNYTFPVRRLGVYRDHSNYELLSTGGILTCTQPSNTVEKIDSLQASQSVMDASELPKHGYSNQTDNDGDPMRQNIPNMVTVTKLIMTGIRCGTTSQTWLQ